MNYHLIFCFWFFFVKTLNIYVCLDNMYLSYNISYISLDIKACPQYNVSCDIVQYIFLNGIVYSVHLQYLHLPQTRFKTHTWVTRCLLCRRHNMFSDCRSNIDMLFVDRINDHSIERSHHFIWWLSYCHMIIIDMLLGAMFKIILSKIIIIIQLWNTRSRKFFNNMITLSFRHRWTTIEIFFCKMQELYLQSFVF